ncbi:MAG: hypothetical protein RIQ89_1936 [Bacteroidota bacterium]|jgi:sphingolipid 4-desaturase/C4-monooxygenase
MNSFKQASYAEPHRLRTRQILRDHPEVRHLIGKNINSIFFIIGMTTAMVLLSFLLKDANWWLIILMAFGIGAFLNHALFVMIHECSHNLIFKGKALNYWASIIANLPHLFPTAVSFTRYHIKHHTHQGVFELDADLPDHWEAKLFGKTTVGKALWIALFPIFQGIRTFRLKEIKPIDSWILLNWIVQLAFNAVVLYFWGPKAFCFLLISFFFSVGFHPLGARWIQEHYLTLDPEQETYSYYGPLNKVAFNVGYHNEHHDFPSIPWNKLPALKNKAPQYYDSLKSHQSWTRLFLRFLFDKNIDLHKRIVRTERGKVKLTDESTPDKDLISQTH